MNGLKMMRAELGMTQTELANALRVSFTSINRWENGKARPNLPAYTLLLNYAVDHGVSKGCLDIMQDSFELTRTRKNTEQVRMKGMMPIDKELLCTLVEEASTAVYVTDAGTDEMLYANRAVEKEVGKKRNLMNGQKCYQFLANREKPCSYCNKGRLKPDTFFESVVESEYTKKLYAVRAKEIFWNGRKAHVRYVTNISSESIFQHVSCGICIYTINDNQNVNLKYANEEYYSLCEGTKEEVDQIFGSDYLSGVCEEYKEYVQEIFTDITTRKTNREFVCDCRSLKGSIRRFLIKAVFVSGESAMRDRIYCTLFEATKEITEKLQLRSAE